MPTTPLFSAISANELSAVLRIPELFHPFIFSIVTEADLESKATELQRYGLYECLWLLLDLPPSEVASRLGIDAETTYPPSSPLKSEPNDVSTPSRPIQILTPDENLKRMLDAPLDEWRTYMHPLQEKIATADLNGPMKVTGGAGTGKTIAAMYRTKWLVEKIFTKEQDHVLFTTFTKNLAHDISLFLKRIIPNQSAFQRVKIRHIDALALELYAPFQHAREHVLYHTSNDEAIRKEVWQEAVATAGKTLPYEMSFFRKEYEEVILPHCVFSLQHYKSISRDGRKEALSEKDRTSVFLVLDQYSKLLRRRNAVESREIRLRLVRNYRLQLQKPFKATIIDEAQDLYEDDFRLLRAITSEGNNDMTLFGDGNQRIYDRPRFSLSSCGIDVRNRSRKLFINYRTTSEIGDFAKRILTIGNPLLTDDFESGPRSTRGTMSLLSGEVPVIRSAENDRLEAEILSHEVQRLTASGISPYKICIISRAHRYVETIIHRLKPLLPKTIIPLEVTSEVSTPSEHHLRFATMHRVKGLEFDAILLCGAHELTDADRNLFYVATTRAKTFLLITYTGSVLPLLR